MAVNVQSALMLVRGGTPDTQNIDLFSTVVCHSLNNFISVCSRRTLKKQTQSCKDKRQCEQMLRSGSV